MISRVLVATNGSPAAAGALRMARLLQERDGSHVDVLAVFDAPVQVYGLGAAGVATGVLSSFAEIGAEELRRKVDVQLAGMGGRASEWPVAVRIGAVAPTIARFAAGSGAELVLLGLRPHAAVERWFGRETLLRLIHLAHLPVLAVPPEARDLPRRVVAAVDFSEPSLRALHRVPGVVAAERELHLVHATRTPALGESWATMDWAKAYRTDVEGRVEALAAELRGSAYPRVHVHVAEAEDPAQEVLRVAEEVEADLVAAGSHGHGYLGRLVLGSVSARLLHAAPCAVLIAPPPEVPSELRSDRETETPRIPLGDA